MRLEAKNENRRVASPESVLIHLKSGAKIIYFFYDFPS